MQANHDVTTVVGFLFPAISHIVWSVWKYAWQGTHFLSSHQTCKAQHFRFAMWNPWCCDRSTRLPNLELCWLIMSQFKVEKGLIALRRLEVSFSHSSVLDGSLEQTVCYGWNLNEFLPSHSSLLSCYSLVTKVKGLSDLSEKAKIGERTEPTTKRSRGSSSSNERPGPAQGRHTSLKVGKLMRNLNCYRSL